MNDRRVAKDKRTIIIIIVISIFYLALGSGYIAFSYHSLKSENEMLLNEVMEQSAQKVDTKLDGDFYSLKTFAAYIGQEERSINEIVSILQFESMVGDSRMLRYSFVGLDGFGYAVSNRKMVNKIDVTGEKFLQQILNGKQSMLRNNVDTITGLDVCIYIEPVYQGDKFIGAHCGTIESNKLGDLLAISYFDKRGLSFITDNNGVCIVAPEGDDVENIKALTEGNNLLQKDNIKDDAAKLSLVRLNNGEKYWLNYKQLKYNDWNLVMLVPHGVINQRTHNVVILNVLILISTLVFISGIFKYILHIKKENEETMYRMAYYDKLTGLYNKNGFAGKVDDILSRYTEGYAVIGFNIDTFKFINQVYGYSYGDLLLKHCAEVLTRELMEDEHCARINDDRFIAIIKYSDAQELKQRVEDLMHEMSSYRYTIESNSKFNIVIHAGVYKISKSNWEKGTDFLIERTRMAMMRVEKTGQNSYAFYNDSVRKRIVFETELENEMQDAFKRGEFEIYLQPRYDAKTNAIIGAEALVRWHHPEKGFLTPDQFLHIFERNGFIVEVDNYVFREVCKKQREWLDAGYKPIKVAIGQSRLSLYKNDYIKSLHETLKRYNARARYIEIEINEHAVITTTDVMKDVIRQAKTMGFSVAIDGFAPGQSSLFILNQIDFDVLKIGSDLFSNVFATPKGQRILEVVISLARSVGFKILAMDIEDENQYNIAKQFDFDYLQGSIISKPVPLNVFEDIHLKKDIL